jgi:DNA modification methylase
VNKLYFGDNLDVLRTIPAECVDLIYLDPPFNSKTDYGVIYGTKRGNSQAQSHAFKDMWTWGADAQRALNETAERHLDAGVLLDSFQRVFPASNMLAYLAMMGVRLIEMQRVLKATGSLYLHCDATASHYLKVLLDSIFGVSNFRSEVIWKRTSAHNSARRWGPIHDTILFVSKSDQYTWNKVLLPYDEKYVRRYYKYTDKEGRLYRLSDLTGSGIRNGESGRSWGAFDPSSHHRHWAIPSVVKDEFPDQDDDLSPHQWLDRFAAEGLVEMTGDGGGWPHVRRYFDRMEGQTIQDIILDIPPLSKRHGERLGYSTQKPLALLERIIRASSNEGDVVLDPFCGCGTAIEAAQTLGRKWIGIDVTYLAIHVVEGRLVKCFGSQIKNTYQLFGRPKDEDDARALAARDWLEFQKWAVFMLGGLPKEKPGADGGIDGIIRYHRVGIEQPNRAVVSVKGGQHVGVDAIHKLKSVVQREKAEVGILVCLDPPTSAMEKEALSEGEIGPPSRRVSKLQIVTAGQLFSPHPIELPGTLDPPEIVRLAAASSRSKKMLKRVQGQTEMLFAMEAKQERYEATKRKPNRSIRPVEIQVVRAQKPSKQK